MILISNLNFKCLVNLFKLLIFNENYSLSDYFDNISISLINNSINSWINNFTAHFTKY